MNIVAIVLSILFVISAIGIGVVIYLSYRNIKVSVFLLSINERCYDWCKRHPNEESSYRWFYDVYVKKYDVYLISFKPLKDEKWFPKDALDRLNS